MTPLRRVSPSTVAAVAFVTSMFMTAVDLQIVNVALPTLSRSFHASIASVQWTVVGYVLSLAVMIPASGWIGDRVGTKRTFLAALGLFTVASALCGTAQSLGELIAARVLQGIGGGMLTPTGTAMLFRAFPPERRARVTRLLVLPVLVGPATAPILGGVFTQSLSWRWVFFVNVPLGTAVLIFCAIHLREHREDEEARRSFDGVGFILGGGGLSLALYAISEGSLHGWGSAGILGPGALALLALGLFVRLEFRRAEPILNLRLLHDRLFRATNVVNCLSTGAFLGILYLTPIFLQEAQHHSPISSGTTTFLEAVGVLFGSQSVGRLYPRIGPRKMAGGAAIVVSALMLGFQFVDDGTSLWLIRGQMFLLGAANSASFLSIQASMFTTISSADTGHAAAIYNTGRQVAIAVSVAILSLVVESVGGSRLGAFHAAYLVAATMSALGGAAALTLIRTRDAAASMRPRESVPAE